MRGMSQEEGINVNGLVFAGVVSTVLVIGSVIALTAMYHNFEGSMAAKVQAEPYAAAGNYQSDQDKVLGSYGWVDEKKGVVAIPIEQAMDIMARRASQTPAKTAGQ
jgi:hypothetical protein